MNRRKTVSVTPAIGASTVAGVIRTEPIWTESGTTIRVGRTLLSDRICSRSTGAELSQNFFTVLFYRSVSAELPFEISQRSFQHFAVLRIRDHLKLLQDSFSRKLEATPSLFFGDLLRGKLLPPRFHGELRLLLLLFD